MNLPHGFKAAANRIAVALRHQMQLPPDAPIDVERLAGRLSLPLVPISVFAAEYPSQVKQLTVQQPGKFSALLLPLPDGGRIVLFNDRHSPGRQNSSIAHEISHALLAHPAIPLFDSSGSRAYDKSTEDEAACLSGYILITNEAAWRIVATHTPAIEACRQYGVSPDMLEFRLNKSGARIRYRNRLRRKAS